MGDFNLRGFNKKKVDGLATMRFVSKPKLSSEIRTTRSGGERGNWGGKGRKERENNVRSHFRMNLMGVFNLWLNGNKVDGLDKGEK